MNFRLLTDEEKITINSTLAPNVVFQDNKFWYVKKTPDVKRPFLGYILGKSFCNIAETKLLSDEEMMELKTLFSFNIDASKDNTLLVRLASSHKLEELPCQTIEKAVATELIYSTWIRRRDTHALNREYNPQGIPVFYDFHIAFLAELKWIHSTLFFKDSPDYGHPPSWKVKEVSEGVTTERVRDVTTQSSLAWHYVRSIKQFVKELSDAEESVKQLASTDIHSLIISASFDLPEADRIEDFLRKNLITLHSDIEEMKKIIFK